MIKKIILLSILVFLSSCSEIKILDDLLKQKISQEDQEIILQSQKDIKSKKHSEAWNRISKISHKYDKNQEFLLNMADMSYALGKYDESITFYKKALLTKKLPNNHKIDIMEKISIAYLKQNDIDNAEKYLVKIIEMDASRSKAINALGISLALAGRNEESLSYFKMLENENPRNFQVLNNLGLASAFYGDFKMAETSLINASKFTPSDNPNKSRIDLNLALIYGMQGKFEQAKKISQPHLNQKELMNNLGYYAIISKKKKIAKKYLENALTETNEHYQKAWDNLQTISK